ncbi:plasmodesmata-located protein 2 [Ziziphus jujuba]|uniref:Plasmodesmata-located protein 2 n=2 Tax=Ziziphus jujuba TaxID=326968 RepID=A0A6P3ZB17_ZIZJJ|nr:plasmodesmata-located protein 2 [Ziziphus jujuba]KAH7543330.1 hypothetical protein FEM48_Zijuj02G0172900 [Ziziphus jujuba var. spinosa]
MDSTSKRALSLLSHALVLFICFSSFLQLARPISDHTNLLYKNCANQTFSSPNKSHLQTLSILFHELVSHSLHSKFFKTIEGDDDMSIFGLFQCRGDISNEDCGNCVNTLPDVSSSLCKESMAARVQLYGCYMRYEPEGVSNMLLKHELVHKICGESKQVIPGFEEMRNGAFAALENAIETSGEQGFYKTKFKSMEVAAQCEADLEVCACGECVSSAVQIADVECGGAASGQIYLNQCFITYSYNFLPNGQATSGNSKSNNGNLKKVAIVLGGLAALGFGLIILLFIKARMKKEEDY